MENHFLIDLLGLFPKGYSVDVSTGDDQMTILIINAETKVPFRMSGPAVEFTTAAILKSIAELRELEGTVRTNKDQWVASVQKAIEDKAEEDAKEAAKKKSGAEAKVKAKSKERIALEVKYKELTGKDALEALLTDAALEKRVKELEKAVKEPGMFAKTEEPVEVASNVVIPNDEQAVVVDESTAIIIPDVPVIPITRPAVSTIPTIGVPTEKVEPAVEFVANPANIDEWE